MEVKKTEGGKIVIILEDEDKNYSNFFDKFFEDLYWYDLYLSQGKYLLDYNTERAYQLFHYETYFGEKEEYYNNLVLSQFNDDKLVLYPLDDDFAKELFEENDENN